MLDPRVLFSGLIRRDKYRPIKRRFVWPPKVHDYQFRLFRRRVRPFRDLLLTFAVTDVLNAFMGGPLMDLVFAETAITRKWVDLRVHSLPHYLKQEDLSRLDDDRFVRSHDNTGKSGGHAMLCALSRLFIEASTGRKAIYPGDSRCAYAGGWADVIADNGSLFVECGNLRTDKFKQAFLAGQTLMVAPYWDGDYMSYRHVHRLSYRPKETYLEAYIALGFEFVITRRGLRVGRAMQEAERVTLNELRNSLTIPIERVKGKMMKIKVTTGETLRILREMNRLTQHELAELSKVPQVTISAVERGRISLGVLRARKLAKALRVHPAVLLFSDLNTAPEPSPAYLRRFKRWAEGKKR